MASVCVALRSFLAAVRSRLPRLLLPLFPFRLPLWPTRFIFSIENAVRFVDDRAPCNRQWNERMILVGDLVDAFV